MRFPRLLRRFAVLFLLAVVPGSLRAAPVPAGTASRSGLWTELAEKPVLAARGNVSADVARRGVVPSEYRTLRLDRAVLNALLATAPREFNRRVALAAGAPEEILPPVTEIELPVPGTAGFERFSVEDSPIMEEGLAARYPEIRTYTLQGLDHPEHAGRMDVTPAGFHAMILSPRGQVFVDPYFLDGSDPTVAIAYRKEDYAASKPFACLVTGNAPSPVARAMEARARAEALERPTGATLRTYRLALACTGEYAAAAGGGTVNGTLAAMVTSINRVSAVYEVDFAIRLKLVNNTDKLIYTNASTDPYSNTAPSTLLTQNQSTCNSVIGSANYDIGHVFSTGGGGLAGLGVVCQTSRKAQGETGLGNPVGDPYDIDYVAHEMGHQFGGNHPFNATSSNCAGGNRNDATAYEVGSGTTIMAYAGICAPQNLAPNSDDYFHTVSYDEIDTYTTSIAGQAIAANVVSTPTGNSPPVLSAVTARIIPPSTPFALTAAATDADGDRITYCWEEFDLNPSTTDAGQDPTASPRDDGASALFRSFAPTVNPTRLFPSLTYILNNANVPPATIGSIISGEFLPATARTMTFRCTARDNRAGGGGSNWVATTVQSVLAATGGETISAFAITAPNAATTLTGGNPLTVTWNTGNSNLTPVSCATCGSRCPRTAVTRSPSCWRRACPTTARRR